MKAFTVRDDKAEGYNVPFFQPTFGLAERAFKEALDDPNNAMAKHKGDLSLWHTGEFDRETGTLKALEKPQLVCNAQ